MLAGGFFAGVDGLHQTDTHDFGRNYLAATDVGA